MKTATTFRLAIPSYLQEQYGSAEKSGADLVELTRQAQDICEMHGETLYIRAGRTIVLSVNYDRTLERGHHKENMTNEDVAALGASFAPKTDAEILAMAKAATPISEDDYASDRQVDAQAAFYEEIEKRLTNAQRRKLERDIFKATTEEMIGHALRAIGLREGALNELSAEYGAWLQAQGIEAGCAEELLHDADHSAHGKSLTADQRAWVVDFIKRWDNIAR